MEQLLTRGTKLDFPVAIPEPSECLWPEAYSEDTAECAFRFLTECWWTWDSATQEVNLVPKKDFIGHFVEEWINAFQNRQPLIIEKSRRMVISWASRGLETWVMGKKRGSSILVDQTHEASSEHLWRCHFALEELRSRRPELRVPVHKPMGSITKHEVTHISLANGSLMAQSHQDAGAEQGKGYTIVILEEISRYRGASKFWGQACLVTQGAPGTFGGWVCGIANPSTNEDWRQVKEMVKPRVLLGLDKS